MVPYGAGIAWPEIDEPPGRDKLAQGFRERGWTTSFNSVRAPRAGQALRVIEGGGKAATHLARLDDQPVDPDALTLIVSRLYGATLRRFGSVIDKALRGAFHA
jgi:hypothetical protein